MSPARNGGRVHCFVLLSPPPPPSRGFPCGSPFNTTNKKCDGSPFAKGNQRKPGTTSFLLLRLATSFQRKWILSTFYMGSHLLHAGKKTTRSHREGMRREHRLQRSHDSRESPGHVSHLVVLHRAFGLSYLEGLGLPVIQGETLSRKERLVLFWKRNMG